MTKPKSYTIKATAKKTGLRFAGGAGAGLMAFALFGGIWQVNHFGWVMTITAFSCGLLAILLGQNFKKTLTALMDNAPWI